LYAERTPFALKRLGSIFMLLAVAAVVLPPEKARAEFTLIDRAEAWFFYIKGALCAPMLHVRSSLVRL
jgi:hypothetical protein